MSKGAWIVFAVLLLVGCGGSDQTGTTTGPLATTTSPSQLAGTTWSTGPVLGLDGKPISNTTGRLQFFDDGSVAGTDGCSTFEGKYTVDDGALLIDGLRFSEPEERLSGFGDPIDPCQDTRYCDDPECGEAAWTATLAYARMSVALGAARSYQIEDDTLTLLTHDGDVLLELARSGR